MEGWLIKLPLSDKLDKATSGVFKKVESPKKHPIFLPRGAKFPYYLCQLCSESHKEKLYDDTLAVHVLDPLHVHRAKDALLERDAVLKRFEWALQFSRDVNYYSSPAFESMLCRYAFVGGDDSSKAAIGKKQKELQVAEPMVQLELALWKAACEQNPPNDKLSPLEWKEWSRSGWKQLKPSMRRDPLTCITALVDPFLGLKKVSK